MTAAPSDARADRAAALAPLARMAPALLALELVLARWSGGPQAPEDLVAAAAGWAALGALAAAGAALHRALAPLACAGLVGFLLTGIVVPALGDADGAVRALAALGLGAALLATLAVAWLAPGRAIEAALLASALGAVAVWLGVDRALPPAGVCALLAGALGAIALAARRVLGALVAAALAAAIAASPQAPPAPRWSDAPVASRGGPDVWLLVVDTVRADRALEMRAAGRLAAHGVAFTNARSTSSWTLPAMASLMTGRALAAHGAWRRPDGGYAPLAPGVATLAERLRDAGWDTAAIVGANAFTSRHFGLARGFDVFDHAMDAQRHALPRGAWQRHARPVAARLATRLGWLGQPPHYDADELVRRAVALHAARRERPLFVWLHFMDVHLPYRHADETELPRRRAHALETGSRDTLAGDPWWAGDAGRAALEAGYAHEVARVDRALEQLLDALGPPPERGRIVVLVSDHGEEFFEHGGFEHGHALWRELLAVPLRIAGLPGVAPGAVVDEPVDLVDLAPTLLAAAGVGADLPGRRLDRGITPRALDAQNLLYGDPLAWSRRLGARKLVVAGERAALYDLAADPGERRPRDAAPTALGAAPPAWPGDGGADAALDAQTRALLRALGYAEPGGR